MKEKPVKQIIIDLPNSRIILPNGEVIPMDEQKMKELREWLSSEYGAIPDVKNS